MADEGKLKELNAIILNAQKLGITKLDLCGRGIDSETLEALMH